MKKDKDLVLVPYEWLPFNAMTLMSEKSGKADETKSAAQFYTEDLNHGGEVFYINKDGYLIHEDTTMYVASDLPAIGNGRTSLCIDVRHKPVIKHNLRKLYSQVMDKMCILVLQFKDNSLIEVQSIIRPCTQ
jgi:hypothetical protein